MTRVVLLMKEIIDNQLKIHIRWIIDVQVSHSNVSVLNTNIASDSIFAIAFVANCPGVDSISNPVLIRSSHPSAYPREDHCCTVFEPEAEL